MKNHTALLLLLLLPLTACIPDHWPQKWVNMVKPKPADAEVPLPQWCYKSLAQVDCYDAPRPDSKDRLISEPPARVLPQPDAKDSVRAVAPAQPESLHGNP
jgi:hypothetical protein